MKRKLLLLVATLAIVANVWSQVGTTFETGGINFKITSTSPAAVEVRSKTPKYTGSITIPATADYSGTSYAVTAIGSFAFDGCSDLSSVSIPSSVKVIGYWAFSDCSGLTTVSIPSSVTSIESFAFNRCSGLSSVTIPSSVTDIKRGAFSRCSGLTSIDVNQGNPQYSSKDGVLYSKQFATIVQYPAGKPGKSFDIPSSVTAIGDYVFNGCDGLTSVGIPSSVTSIGSLAFDGCSALTFIDVDQGNSQYTSKDGVLYNKQFTTLVKYPVGKPGISFDISSSVTAIGNNAFSGCRGLSTVSIPSSVTSIGNWAFSSCSGLSSVNIPSSVTVIGDWAFSFCYGLSSVHVPSSVTAIGKSAFSFCSGLSSVSISSSVMTIGDEAFEYCSNLTSVNIPSSVTAMGRKVFYECEKLTSITAEASVPVDLSSSSDVFYLVPTSVCTLRVPRGSLAAYKSAVQWKDFVNIVEMDVNEDKTVPVISLKGPATVEIALNSTYSDAGAIATDNVDGDISSKIVVAGTVDTKTIGTYALTYNVTDAAGNKAAQVIRTVAVKEKTATDDNAYHDMIFYPVPMKDMLTVSLGSLVASLVQVIDARGVVVIEQAGTRSGEIQLFTSALTPGTYTLRVVTASGIVLRQVVK